MPTARTLRAFGRLLEIVATLRSPEGCPWDAEQTPESLKPYLLEETYEVLEAIDGGEPSAICDELGDLLLQVIFQARLFEERQAFDVGDVADAIADKLIRRHPHVFAERRQSSIEALDAQWDRIKAREKERRGEFPTLLGGVPRHLPALLRARKLSEKASRVGFDWPAVDGIFAKIEEELEEFKDALQHADQQAMADELGDLLFSIVNLGRFLNIDAEEALRQTANRFVARFGHIEATLAERGRTLQQSSPEEMDSLWNEAKRREREKRGEPAKS
ncbi:MAG TPA: nucleoside triphosphate pyrophosphohydrolase [Desulfuromonadales bacterium]|nr:nucleoside triphosphate pyrophosphohydrolase [Desulfuromonadales bacterium]